MSQALRIVVTVSDRGMRNPTLRMADLLEVYAQELRDEATGGAFVSAPGYTTLMNGDRLEVLSELPCP